MTLTVMGKQYICENFGDASFCCATSGLSWLYTVGGMDYNETGGTAQAVSRLASGLIDSLTMTSPARGTFTQAMLNAANEQSVTLSDCQEITLHDEPSEDQWCFIPCSTHTDQNTCENIYHCYWYNGNCHADPPTCAGLNNEPDCTRYGCYWYDGACHPTWTCENIVNPADCVAYGCYWYNGACHSAAPDCETLNNEPDCSAYGCHWYNGICHTIDQPELCYWVDAKGGPANIVITDVFEMVDSYLFTVPPSGYSFVPTLQNAFGVIDYFLGFNGDPLTGCAKFL